MENLVFIKPAHGGVQWRKRKLELQKRKVDSAIFIKSNHIGKKIEFTNL